jgi:hypothetical protein
MIQDHGNVFQFDIGLDSGLHSKSGNWLSDPECANFGFQSEFANKIVAILPFHFNVFNNIHFDSMNPVIIHFDFLELGTQFQNQFSKFISCSACNSMKHIFIFCDHQATSRE